MISNLTPERQRKLAIGLVTLLALVIIWRMGGPGLSSWLAGDSTDTQREARRNAMAGVDIVDLDLGALESSPATYTPDRNLFRYPPPPPPPRPVDIPRAEPAPRVEQPIKELEPPKPVPPKLPYDLLGIFGPERRRIAALKEGDDIVNALVAETLKDKFIVHDIGLNTVEFHFVGFSDEHSETLKVEPERR